jgi:RNA polymerase sigma-70 factor (ECF subfamily)
VKGTAQQDALYQETIATFGAAIERLARAYEADADKRNDLLQEIHLALWRSFQIFEDRCSLRTWMYRVAHNAATSYVVRQSRLNSSALSSLEKVETAEQVDYERQAERRMALDQLFRLIHKLKPPDRQIMLLYLEGMDAPTIGEITGLSSGHVRTQIYRIKTILNRRFHGRDERG